MKNNNKWKTAAAKKKKLHYEEDGIQNQDNKIKDKEDMLLTISNGMLSFISKTIALIDNIKARRYHLQSRTLVVVKERSYPKLSDKLTAPKARSQLVYASVNAGLHLCTT